MRNLRAVQPLPDARGPDVRFCRSCRHAEPAWCLHSVSQKRFYMRRLLQQVAGGALGAAAAGAKGLDRCSRCAQAHSLVSLWHMSAVWEVFERCSTADEDRKRQHLEKLLGCHAGQGHEHICLLHDEWQTAIGKCTTTDMPYLTHCRATATLWGIVQGNVDYSRRAASLQGASKDKLLYHVAIGSNCNKDVSSGEAAFLPLQHYFFGGCPLLHVDGTHACLACSFVAVKAPIGQCSVLAGAGRAEERQASQVNALPH